MRDRELIIEKATENGFELIKFEGPLTLSNLFELQDCLRTDPRRKTIIDLSGVPYVDSAGLGALLSFHASCKRSGREYTLAAMHARVYTMFAASKVDTLVHISRSIADAEAFLSK